MIRTLFIIAMMSVSAECVGVEISRIAGCSGDVLRLRGDIEQGDFVRFRSHFDAERRVIGVDLGSDGGALEDGFRMAALAHRKRLTAYVSTECDSACAFIFLVARKRYISRGAKIGVHSVGNNYGAEDVKTVRDTVQLARLSAKLGVPSSTIGKMVATPPGKITYLDRRDLTALRAIARDPFARLAKAPNHAGCGSSPTRDKGLEASARQPAEVIATDGAQ